MIDVDNILKKNARKKERINQPHNPYTGEGCQGDRVHLFIEDAPSCYTSMYLPEEMAKAGVFKGLKKHGSIEKYFKSKKVKFNRELYLQFWVTFCELRIEYDFEFFAATYLHIKDKVSARDIDFTLNRGQRRLLDKLESMRKAGVPIRVVLLKARQWGGSTLVQLYMLWIQLVHRKNWNSVICAHVKDAAITIRAMFENAINNMPPIGATEHHIKAYNGTQNIKHVPERGCLITVGTAEEPESVRSQDAKMAHFSEVGLYPDTEKKKTADLVSSIIGSVPRAPLTMIVYESTARGVGGFYHTEWEKAKKGESGFEPVFVEWFIIDIYKEDFNGYYYNQSGKRRKGTAEDFVSSLSEYELNLFTNHEECTLENLNWYRGKLSEMTSHAMMKQEYPSDDIEAFQDSGTPAFRAEDVESQRKYCDDPIAIGDIASDLPASSCNINPGQNKSILTGVKFVPDKDLLSTILSADPKLRDRKEQCKLRIWEMPEYDNISNRYVVVVDTGGRSEDADYSVITVFDRNLMRWGGVPEVVAEWRGHIDHDILVWISAQISVLYDNALLVIESNTHETERNDGDHAEFIFDTIAEFYPNLYSRTPADKIIEGAPVKYGFHMNKSTKTLVVDYYVGALREGGYRERNEKCLNEARVFEKKNGGAYEAKEGYHDDILITRMIGVYICYILPIPRAIARSITQPKKTVGMSSM